MQCRPFGAGRRGDGPRWIVAVTRAGARAPTEQKVGRAVAGRGVAALHAAGPGLLVSSLSAACREAGRPEEGGRWSQSGSAEATLRCPAHLRHGGGARGRWRAETHARSAAVRLRVGQRRLQVAREGGAYPGRWRRGGGQRRGRARGRRAAEVCRAGRGARLGRASCGGLRPPRPPSRRPAARPGARREEKRAATRVVARPKGGGRAPRSPRPWGSRASRGGSGRCAHPPGG